MIRRLRAAKSRDSLNDHSNPVVFLSMTAPTIAARRPLIPHERAELLETAARLRAEVAGRMVGQERVLDEILMALLAGGHALLVGVPGLAKTLMIRSVTEAMRLAFRRIQLTPDLVPSDITGTEVMEEDAGSHARLCRFVQGPIFANILLAEEINRAPPRTQAALLESMQEHSVTVAGKTMPLPAPFFVLATQSLIEQEGTYPLSEAQLDHFLFDIRVSYPDEEAEIAILRNTTGREYAPLEAVIDAAQTIALQRMVRDVPVADVILQYVARLVRATRPDEKDATRTVKQFVRWGAGPRAGQALVLGAKAHALLAGRNAVTPADIRRVAHPVLRHRILLNFAAEAERLSAERLVDDLLEHVPMPKSDIRV